jgi:long-chain acyl-CoA synthetase
VLLKPNQDLDADSLLQWSKDNMANYKVPREVEFVRELPTNAAGKIMKYLLKDES